MDATPHFPIYLDYSATNPCDPRVVDAIIPWLREHFGNPASRSHAWGWEAEAAVEKAREHVAALIGARNPTTSPSKAQPVSTKPRAST
jgi:cysteine desulfurase